MLLTKIHKPSSGTNLVQRNALFDQLNEGFKRKLILVSANAGFGKTTVVSDWINKNKIPCAWFSIDKNDNDPTDFFNYVITSIQSLFNGFGKKAIEILNSPQKPSAESIVNLLINDILEIDNEFTLVLDDFHLINNIEISQAMAYLLEHMPGNIHVVLLSRSDPNLPLAKLRSQQQLLELRSADLSFSANDVSILFNKKLKSQLSETDITTLQEKTEGWVAGLQLAALSMQATNNNSDFINALAGNNRYIMDYLIEEVLKAQTDAMQEFLLKTSVLEQISGSLCNAVLGLNNCQTILEELETNNMFVFPLDNERNWYRYHHLFADLLKQKLLQNNEQEIIEIHNKACAWFEQNNMIELAINHALAINNFDKSIKLIEKIVEQLWENGYHSAINEYGRIIPNKFIQQSPDFCLYYAWILIAAGQIEKAKPLLSSAKQVIEESLNKSTEKDLAHEKKLLGKISVAYTYLLSHQEHSSEIYKHCQLAMNLLTNDDPFWYSWAWFSNAIANFSDGKIIESNAAFQKAFDYAKTSGNIYLISTIVIRMAENEQQLGHYKAAYNKCNHLLKLMNEKGLEQLAKTEWIYAPIYLMMGTCQFMWADNEKAYSNIKIAYDLSKNSNDSYTRIFVLMVYSIVLRQQRNNESVNATIELNELISNTETPPFLTHMHLSWKIFILCEDNKIEEAMQLLIKSGLDKIGKKDIINEPVLCSYIHVLIIENKIDEAENIIIEILEQAIKGNRVERIIELLISHAIVLYIKGENHKAITKMLQAMEVASTEELLSYFTYSVHDINPILNETFKAYSTKTTSALGINVPKEFIHKLKAALEKNKKTISSFKESELSSRELDTLKQIAKELTNQEIADRLFISINTVKTHVKNILLKLEANSRTKAVDKAKELGLF